MSLKINCKTNHVCRKALITLAYSSRDQSHVRILISQVTHFTIYEPIQRSSCELFHSNRWVIFWGHHFLHDKCSTFLILSDSTMTLKRYVLFVAELCLTSNVLTKTVPDYASHHFDFWYKKGHPCCICVSLLFKISCFLVARQICYFTFQRLAKAEVLLAFTSQLLCERFTRTPSKECNLCHQLQCFSYL